MEGGTMSNGMTKYEILNNINSGTFVFLAENNEDVKKVLDFQAVVNVMKSLEKSGFIKVFAYCPSMKFSFNKAALFDRVIVENLTTTGKSELQRLIPVGRQLSEYY